MPSHRERQKQTRRESILAAGRKLFHEKGYSKTNMVAIADAANVGVATIYTYFENKEGVVSALVYKDFSEVCEEVEDRLTCLPDNPVKAVSSLLEIYRKFDTYISYELMRAFLSQAKTKGPVRSAFDWSHNLQVSHVKTALEHAQQAGKICPALDVEAAAGIVIDLHDRHVDRMMIHADARHDYRQFEKYLSVMFDAWLN